jgi:SAM-dependent methyltransferase
MGSEEMRRFWDRRAREDAFYFVDNRLDYGRPDVDWFWADGERQLDLLLDRTGARLERTDEVVEIGCGVGRLTRAVAQRTEHVTALDVSPRMLELAREHNPQLANVTWLEGDGQTLRGVEDASADACMSVVVFQHLPDPELTYGYVREMGRVLRPGGEAAFQVSNDPAIHRPRPLGERLRVRARSALGRGPGGQSGRPWRGSAVDLERLTAAAAEAGLELQQVHGEGTQMCLVRLKRV